MAADGKPNLLLITADDMNWDAVGAFGCPTPGTTPNLDRLAAQGIRFEHSHVTIAVCQPSRSSMMTGRYPHRNGGEGFYHLRHPDVPLLPQLLRDHDYRVGILGKVGHSTPYGDFAWDCVLDQNELGFGRNPNVYADSMEAFIHDAANAERPFFLMVNSHDPHRPFFGNDKAEWYRQDASRPSAMVPSKVFSPDEVVVPGFLPDLPEVRLEISEYYSSVRRCDDTVGHILQVLDKLKMSENTVVLFLSDNGMAFPFSKTNCYLNSTRTPMIMRWPGNIRPGTVECEHFVSGIDLMPTFLAIAGIAPPPGLDGNSFLPLLHGKTQTGRETVFTQFHQTAGKRNYPMRCVQDRRYGYIFNPWSDGDRVFRNESQSGRTFPAMQIAAGSDPAIADRVELFLHRVPEELYDFNADPDAHDNLIDRPEYGAILRDMRKQMETYLVATGDPALQAFRNRSEKNEVDRFLDDMVREIGGIK